MTSASPRHLISIANLSSAELSSLVSRAISHKRAIKANVYPPKCGLGLAGKAVPLIFSKRSTRTRISSEAAVNYLGGHPMFLGKDDIQLGVNETLYDSARVISSMTSCIIARVGPHSDILGLAESSSVPIINALCDTYHPLQAITDIMTIKENFGETKGLKLAWVGDANNVLHDLAIACAKSGIDVSAATPKEYPVSPIIIQQIKEAAALSGSTLELTTDPLIAVKNADIVVTDTWISMGEESQKALKMKQFAGYQITNEMMQSGGAKPDWKFMHCLPRHPEEVSDEVFYSNRSLVFPEAENRLYAAIAALEGFVVNKGQLL
ncbi:ornithine carbamoyltransferase [Nadsonia fulvescens var. elongata DSM 6958]|uniref:ornithine carbamoyltransferase n=1 Tax=Nadsonia fulvescens var. elongata DSM 6958 TaxID=857566 RepID=A0A1E3PGT2_9ASCO|nr:ornithine carbamoyltransferase [Nadsonia fulvescens var. elongata DSM 6958]